MAKPTSIDGNRGMRIILKMIWKMIAKVLIYSRSTK